MMPGTELPAEPYVEPGPPPPGEYYECYGVWLVTETWRWNGHSWEFESAQYDLLYVVC